MGQQFRVEVYNHSATEMVFAVSNQNCIHIPNHAKITVAPFTWGYFDLLEISNDFLKACFASDSKFNLIAYRDGQKIANVVYKGYLSVKRVYYAPSLKQPLNGIAVHTNRGFGPISLQYLVFERIEAFADLFFTGRGIYAERTLDPYVFCTSIDQAQSTDILGMLPTVLINNNSQFVKSVDDSALFGVIKRWVDLGLNVVPPLFSAFKTLDRNAKLAPTDFQHAWSQAKTAILGYLNLYLAAVQASGEYTILAYEDERIPTLHVIFADSAASSHDLMKGNFELPRPPHCSNSFYDNILHTPTDASNQIRDMHSVAGRMSKICELRAYSTSQALDSNAAGAVYQHAPNHGQHQQWLIELVDADSASYRLTNIATTRCLDGNGEKVYTHPANAGEYQQWQIEKVTHEQPVFTIKSRKTGKYLQVNAEGVSFSNTPTAATYWQLAFA